jgi:hypothetical protein
LLYAPGIPISDSRLHHPAERPKLTVQTRAIIGGAPTRVSDNNHAQIALRRTQVSVAFSRLAAHRSSRRTACTVHSLAGRSSRVWGIP